LDTGAVQRSASPSPLEVGRVLEEFRLRFQELRPGGEEVPDFEAFVREKMRALGFEELGSAPLLPELQREALRGLGVGLGSQMAQLLGRMAGWHSEARAPKSKPETKSKPATSVKLLRLELGSVLAADKTATAGLRMELGRVRRKLSQRLGWELSGVQLASCKELEPRRWRLLLRGEETATGEGLEAVGATLEAVLSQRAEALLPFSDFATMLKQPGCKLVVKELRRFGLEKAMLWTLCRRVVAAGGHMREPLTVLERILEAATTSQELPFLVQAVLSASSEL
jgi:flagellar biosynthesis component FlhA